MRFATSESLPEVTAGKVTGGNIAVMAPRTVRPLTAGNRRVPRAVREQQMLAVAERAFADRGFHAASVDAIAEGSGISKPMIYAYFGSKEGLYRACMERARTRLLEALRAGVDPAAPPDQQLWHGLLAVFTFVERERDSWAILLGEVTAGTGPFAAEGAAVRREMAALVADLLRRAAPPRASTEDARWSRSSRSPAR